MIRILVVEDEVIVRDNLVELLKEEGYEALEARNGEEGVQLARETLPDLILCDIRMPRLDGFGVLARLSQDPLTAVLPFIFLTARTEKSDQRMGMGMGADDYITKPFTRKEVLTSVKRRLEKRAALTEQASQKLLELQGRISRGLPYELMAPLSILLGHSETLVKADWLESDPTQVRAVARELNRASERLLRLVQNYLFYAELESLQADPQRRGLLENEICLQSDLLLSDLAREVAASFGRSEDLKLKLAAVNLRVAEIFFQTVGEEILDRAFRGSLPGSPVEVEGGFITDGFYRFVILDRGGRLPPQVSPVGNIQFELENSPIGILLARRIIEIYKGRLRLEGDAIGGNRVEIELPYHSS